jgi:hypothetical protein
MKRPRIETPRDALAAAKAIHGAKTEQGYCFMFNAAVHELERVEEQIKNRAGEQPGNDALREMARLQSESDIQCRAFWRDVLACYTQIYDYRRQRWMSEYHNVQTAAMLAEPDT